MEEGEGSAPRWLRGAAVAAGTLGQVCGPPGGCAHSILSMLYDAIPRALRQARGRGLIVWLGLIDRRTVFKLGSEKSVSEVLIVFSEAT